MGSGQHKDANIDIYVETNKPLYAASQYVQGCIYIICRVASPYNGLFLKIHCYEKVYWSSGNGKNRSTYHNSACSYEQILPVYDFTDRVIPQGQHTFPFKFLLPSELPGSLYEGYSNFIRYSLCAELSPIAQPNVQKYPQNYQIFLNILEPSRLPPGGAHIQKTNNPKCCGCCADYGFVKVSLTSERSVVRDGDNFGINVVIDNTQGKKQVQNLTLNFKKMDFKVSQGGSTRNMNQNTIKLYTHPGKIGPGTSETINIQANIPMGYSSQSTAIGTIIAKYYALTIDSSMGCCSVGADTVLHIVYHSSNQVLQALKTIPPPMNWHPQVYKPAVFNNLKPYIYIPWPQIPVHNRLNLDQIQHYGNLQKMNNQNQQYPMHQGKGQPYFKDQYSPGMPNNLEGTNQQQHSQQYIYKHGGKANHC